MQLGVVNLKLNIVHMHIGFCARIYLQVESRLERKEGEAVREREVAHAREKLVR